LTDVIETLRNLLVSFRAAGRISDEEELHVFAFTLREGIREPQSLRAPESRYAITPLPLLTLFRQQRSLVSMEQAVQNRQH
jgi:hypothetical protein